MVRNVERWVLGIATLLLAALGLGCPNSDVLTTEPGRGTLVYQVQLPSGTGRYERGSFAILSLKVQPENAQADSALGLPITILDTTRLDISLTDTNPLSTNGVPLNEGDYRVVSLNVDFIQIVDENPAAPPTSCLEAVLNRTDVHGRLPPPEATGAHEVAITDFNPVPTFHVDRNGEGTLKLNIDGSALIALIEGGLTQCRPAFCSFEPGRLCALDTDCSTPTCNRPLGACTDNPGTPCADATDCPVGDTCDRPDGVCALGGAPCIDDGGCQSFCCHNPRNGLGECDLSRDPLKCTSNVTIPCFQVYSPPTADQLRTVFTFE